MVLDLIEDTAPVINARAEIEFEKVLELFKKDFDTYDIEFNIFGNFLTCNISRFERLKNLKSSKQVFTINLNNSNIIKLISGSPGQLKHTESTVLINVYDPILNSIGGAWFTQKIPLGRVPFIEIKNMHNQYLNKYLIKYQTPYAYENIKTVNAYTYAAVVGYYNVPMTIPKTEIETEINEPNKYVYALRCKEKIENENSKYIMSSFSDYTTTNLLKSVVEPKDDVIDFGNCQLYMPYGRGEEIYNKLHRILGSAEKEPVAAVLSSTKIISSE